MKEAPSLLDVLNWSRDVSLYIVMNEPVTPTSRALLEAIQNLTRLARIALESPNPEYLREAVRHDPYCHAAYAYGYRDAALRLTGASR